MIEKMEQNIIEMITSDMLEEAFMFLLSGIAAGIVGFFIMGFGIDRNVGLVVGILGVGVAIVGAIILSFFTIEMLVVCIYHFGIRRNQKTIED